MGWPHVAGVVTVLLLGVVAVAGNAPALLDVEKGAGVVSGSILLVPPPGPRSAVPRPPSVQCASLTQAGRGSGDILRDRQPDVLYVRPSGDGRSWEALRTGEPAYAVGEGSQWQGDAYVPEM